MNWVTTSIYEKLFRAVVEGKKRHIWVAGGTAASETFSILQLLYLMGEYAKSPILISVVSKSIPHIKRGCLRDFQRILGDAFDITRFNRTDLIYTFANEAKIEFFSA